MKTINVDHEKCINFGVIPVNLIKNDTPDKELWHLIRETRDTGPFYRSRKTVFDTSVAKSNYTEND